MRQDQSPCDEISACVPLGLSLSCKGTAAGIPQQRRHEYKGKPEQSHIPSPASAWRLWGRKALWCFSVFPLLRLELASHLKELIKEGNQSPERRLLQQPGCGAGCNADFCAWYQSQPCTGGADAGFCSDTLVNRQNKLRQFLRTVCRSGRPASSPILPLNLAAFNP